MFVMLVASYEIQCNEVQNLTGRSEGKSPCWIGRHRRVCNKLDLEVRLLNIICPAPDKLCQHGNEPVCSITDGEFRD
jgi:hypothetical protein